MSCAVPARSIGPATRRAPAPRTAHAENLDRVPSGRGVDEEIDRLAAVDAGLRRVAFDLARLRRIGQVPVRRSGLLVLDDGREREGEQQGQHRAD